MEKFKSIGAIDSAIANIDNALLDLTAKIQSIKDVKEDFDMAWQSQEALIVKNKINELTTNLEALQKGITNIKIKVNNAKSLAVAADTTVFTDANNSQN